MRRRLPLFWCSFTSFSSFSPSKEQNQVMLPGDENYNCIHAISKAVARASQLLVAYGVLLAPALGPVGTLP